MEMEMEMNNPISEEIEGVNWGDSPINTLFIRYNMLAVRDVVKRIDRGFVITNPDFKRTFLWDDAKQSKLIESVLMGIPLPAFYLAENASCQLSVLDGLQRFLALARYIKNDLRLNLPNQQYFHNKKFDDLSPQFQNRIEDCILVLYIIDANVPKRYYLDIFERVNRCHNLGGKR